MKIWLLGIPFDALTDQETEKKALSFLKKFEQDSKPRYITSPSFRAIDNSYSFLGIKEEEVLSHYRQADLSLLSQKPLLILSWFLGDPLPATIKSHRLVKELIETMTFKSKSIFILGDKASDVQRGALEITARFPLVNISGALAPPIAFEGKHLENVLERDRVILNSIHEAKPDLLLLKLEKKKAALWLNRVKKELKVALSMGLGTALETYPYRNGHGFFRKIFEVLRETISSIGRVFKFLFFSIPLALFYKINEGVSSFTHIKKCMTLCQKATLLFLSEKKTIEVLRLPCLLDKERVQTLQAGLESYLEQDEFIVDFKALKHMDLFGFQFLYTLWRNRKNIGKGIIGINMSGDIRFLIKLNKLWDIIGDDIVAGPKEALDRINEIDSLFMSVEQDEEGVHLYFLGNLASRVDYERLLEVILPIAENKAVIVHKEYVTKTKAYGEWFLKRLFTQASCKFSK